MNKNLLYSFKDEFSNVDFNDKRLTNRFDKICGAFNQKPQAIISHVIQNVYDCKAAYRFWENPKVSMEKIMDSHRRAIEKKIDSNENFILELQDSSELNFSTHLKKENMGPIAGGGHLKGLEMHSSLLVTPSGLPLGIGSLNIWAREEKNSKKGKDYRFIPWENKESIKWAKALEDVDKINLKEATRVLIADREADFFEFLDKVETEKRKMIIRLRWDRKISESEMSVKEIVDQQAIVGTFEVKIGGKGGPNFREERIAKIAVKFADVELIFSQRGRSKNNTKVPVTIVHAKEIDPPDGQTPIEWYLITNLDVNSFEDAKRVIIFYSKRWLIEEFHKILKGGVKIEEVRLDSSEKTQKFISFLAILSFRLLLISRINRIDSELPCNMVFSELEWELAYKKAYKKKCIEHVPSVNEIVRAIAMLGGYFGRKGDGPPGVMTLWRGWMRLHEMINAILEFSEGIKRCGY